MHEGRSLSCPSWRASAATFRFSLSPKITPSGILDRRPNIPTKLRNPGWEKQTYNMQEVLDFESREDGADMAPTENAQGHCGDRVKVMGKGGATCASASRKQPRTDSQTLHRLFYFSKVQIPRGQGRAWGLGLGAGQGRG